LGKYQGVPRHNRVCTKCSSNVIEDELHFLIEIIKRQDALTFKEDHASK
jgi:hypothetical protein